MRCPSSCTEFEKRFLKLLRLADWHSIQVVQSSIHSFTQRVYFTIQHFKVLHDPLHINQGLFLNPIILPKAFASTEDWFWHYPQLCDQVSTISPIFLNDFHAEECFCTQPISFREFLHITFIFILSINHEVLSIENDQHYKIYICGGLLNITYL